LIPTLQKNTVEFLRLSRLYAARTGAHPALGANPTLGSLLSALSGKGRADPDTRRRLICAVIAEHQAAPGPLGAAIALHAFCGMLVRLSRSLVGVDDPEDADGIVVAGFIEALRRVRPGRDPDRIGMYVRQETRRAVFAALRRDARAREGLDEDEESVAIECDAIADPESLAPLEDRLLFYRPRVDAIPDETLLTAHAVRGGLRRLAEHLFEDASPLERRRVYRQLVGRTRQLLAAAK